AQPARRSTGSGGGAQAAPAPAPAPAPGPSQAQLRSAQGEWAAAINALIQRQARWPAGAPSGAARVRIAVAPTGAVAGLSLAASSGSPALDRAALGAVRRVGRLPAAPAVLQGRQASYGFTLTVRF
ncbi:MAG: TonB family protein, partial [Hasllibacter sp.]